MGKSGKKTIKVAIHQPGYHRQGNGVGQVGWEGVV
jgi:hypothetical protein